MANSLSSFTTIATIATTTLVINSGVEIQAIYHDLGTQTSTSTSDSTMVTSDSTQDTADEE